MLIKKKTLLCSMLLFVMAVIGSSLIYLLFDFKNNDVTPNVRLFGVTQLIMIGLTVLLFLANIGKQNQFFLWVTYFIYGLLLFIQIVPALLWFLFDGQIVNDKPYDGVTGHWIYGAFHLAIIFWGIFNTIGYRIINPIKH